MYAREMQIIAVRARPALLSVNWTTHSLLTLVVITILAILAGWFRIGMFLTLEMTLIKLLSDVIVCAAAGAGLPSAKVPSHTGLVITKRT